MPDEALAERSEYCGNCQTDTPHEVTIEFRWESDEECSRQPFRVAECQDCGETSTKR